MEIFGLKTVLIETGWLNDEVYVSNEIFITLVLKIIF